MLRSAQKKIGVGQQIEEIFRPPSRAFVSATYAQQVLLDSPVLYLRFEETSGTTCADSSGNGLTGATNGTVTRNVASRANLGVGVTLSGASTSYVSVADNAALDITGAFTYEAWINPSSYSGDPYIFTKGKDDSTHAGYAVWLESSAGHRLRLERAGIGSLGTATGSAIPLSTWSHVVVTRDGSGNIIYYLNGVQSGSTFTDTTAVQATSQPFLVGGISIASVVSETLNGSIDEVAVYNTALSAARVTAHFNAG